MSSDLEDFWATCQHRRGGRILYSASFTPDLQRRLCEHIGGRDIAAHYGFFSPVRVQVRRPEALGELDYSSYWDGVELPEGTTINEDGVAQVPSGFYHFYKYVSPLRDAKSIGEMENYPLDDMSQWDSSYMGPIVDDAHARGLVVTGFAGHMYETAWQIRGYEQFLMDMIERPSWAECLLERIARQNMVRAVAFAKAGVDRIRTGDDVANQKAMMFAPRLWRKMIHSRWARVWAAAKRINPNVQIWYHSDGNITEVIGELVEAGLDILNPVQPECLDIDAIHARFGDRLTFDGCVGTQSTMPFGSPADVRRRVKELIDKYGRNGGLMIAPTHVLEPEVPIANIEAFAEVCGEYGSFR